MTWQEQFKQEFSIHFSESELQFALQFILEVESKAIRRCDKVYKDKIEKAVADTIERCAKEAEAPVKRDRGDTVCESKIKWEIAEAIRSLKKS